MEALNRKPDLKIRGSITLSDGTVIESIAITARTAMTIANNKRLSDTEKGIHITAAKILVNSQRVTPDDLLDSFTDEELETIIKFVNKTDEKNE